MPPTLLPEQPTRLQRLAAQWRNPDSPLRCLAWGAFTGLSAPGYYLLGLPVWLLPWFGLIAPFRTLAAVTPRHAFQLGLAWGLGYNLVYLIWFWGLHPAMWMGFNPFASILVSMGAWLLAAGWSALFCGLIFAAIRLVCKNCHWLLQGLIAAILWVVGWQLHQMTDLGIPWANLEYTQAQFPFFRGLAYLFHSTPLAYLGGGGVWVGALMVAHNYVWAHWLDWEQETFGKIRWLWRVVMLLLIPVALACCPSPLATVPTWPVPTVIIQGNLPIDVIRSSQRSQVAAETHYLSPLIRAEFAPGTLIILPEEGAIPQLVDEAHPLDNPALRRMQEVVEARSLLLVTGITAQAKGPVYYNAAVMLSPLGLTTDRIYHKQRLVPFGEKTPIVPESWLSTALEQIGADYSTPFHAGTDVHPLTFPNGRHRLGPLVCFELIYPDLSTRYRDQSADLLVNVSNLGWFHGNRWIERQFLAIGQMRAAENHLPLAIAANTGVSAMIDANGTLLKTTPSKQEAILTLLPGGDPVPPETGNGKSTPRN